MSKEKICGVYKITNPKGKIYVGSSKNIKRRWVHYNNVLCHGQPKLYNSLKKYGVREHIFEIIEECDFDNLYDRERYWGEYYNVLETGLNLSLPSTGDKPTIVSEETRRKMSLARKGRVSNRKGAKLTLEQRQAMSIARKGENGSFYGRKHTPESIEKMRISSTGFRHSEETKRKYSETRRGRKGTPHTEGTKEYLRQINLGKTLSAEVRQKISEGATTNRIVIDTQTGIFFNSVVEAAKAYNLNRSTLSNYLGGHKKNKTNLIYA